MLVVDWLTFYVVGVAIGFLVGYEKRTLTIITKLRILPCDKCGFVRYTTDEPDSKHSGDLPFRAKEIKPGNINPGKSKICP